RPSARPARHLPRPLSSRALQQGLRRAARDPAPHRLPADRDGALPLQLLLLRRGRRAHLDAGSARRGSARAQPPAGGRGGFRTRGVRGELSEGPHHVRGRAKGDRQRRPVRGARAHRAGTRGARGAPARALFSGRSVSKEQVMKILVAVKQVAALDEDFEIRADGKDVDPDFLVRDLNEWDDYSLEEAMKIKEAAATPVEVVAVCVGPEDADEALRKCLAKGADRAIRVWDETVAGSD